jgi:transcriptional regulator with XRE-family HTH domain
MDTVMGKATDASSNELGDFLRARRAALTPDDVGIRQGGKLRRVPGLRREEVAQLAAISTDYYTRLEQGRISPSASVLASLARILRLIDDERTYLYSLAGKSAAAHAPREAPIVQPRLQEIINRLDAPALIATRTLDILAWNPLAAALMLDFADVPESERNWLRLLFNDPKLRRLFPDWDDLARLTVAYVRMEAAHRPDDIHLATLVDDLSAQHDQFRAWWDDHNVAVRREGTRRVEHPSAGPMTLEWTTLTVDADPNQQLTVFTTEPGSPSEEALRRLAAETPTDSGSMPSSVD